MSAGVVLRRLLFPPRCASCGALLGGADKNAPLALCRACEVKWDAHKNALCRCCGYPVADCTRSVPMLTRHGVDTLLKLTEYDPQKPQSVASRVIFKLKDKESAELQAYLARELAPKIEEQLVRLGQTRENSVLVWAPRSKKSLRERGFDQSKGLCTALARELGIGKPVQMVRRTGGSVQKMLGQEQRAKNAFAAFEAVPKHCADLKGKCVILVDDVVTTGSTLSAVAAKIKTYKPGHVIGVCIAVDIPPERRG